MNETRVPHPQLCENCRCQLDYIDIPGPFEGGIVTIAGKTFELVPWIPCGNLEDGRACPRKATHVVSGGRLKDHPVCESHAEAVREAACRCDREVFVEPLNSCLNGGWS